MYLSSLLKSRTQSEKDAAIALDRAAKGVVDVNKDTVEDVSSGFERLSWYSSCLTKNYADVCSELRKEDWRMVKAIFEIFKREDVVRDIVKIFFEDELKKFNSNQIRYIDRELAKFLSSYQAGKVSKAMMANAVSIAVTKSFGFSNSFMGKLNKATMIAVSGLAFYGNVQKASLEARKLRMLYPGVYWVLYNNKIEMLYFLVSDEINKALLNSSGLRGEERFISIVKSLSA